MRVVRVMYGGNPECHLEDRNRTAKEQERTSHQDGPWVHQQSGDVGGDNRARANTVDRKPEDPLPCIEGQCGDGKDREEDQEQPRYAWVGHSVAEFAERSGQGPLCWHAKPSLSMGASPPTPLGWSPRLGAGLGLPWFGHVSLLRMPEHAISTCRSHGPTAGESGKGTKIVENLACTTD